MMILDSFDDKPKGGGPSNGNGSTGPETSTTSQTNGGGANGDSKPEVCCFVKGDFSSFRFHPSVREPVTRISYIDSCRQSMLELLY